MMYYICMLFFYQERLQTGDYYFFPSLLSIYLCPGSDDKRIIVWDCDRGLPLSTILLHVPILGLDMSSDVSRVVVHLYDSRHLPIICLHNTPATYVKAPAYVAPTPVAPVIDGMFYLFFVLQTPGPN